MAPTHYLTLLESCYVATLLAALSRTAAQVRAQHSTATAQHSRVSRRDSAVPSGVVLKIPPAQSQPTPSNAGSAADASGPSIAQYPGLGCRAFRGGVQRSSRPAQRRLVSMCRRLAAASEPAARRKIASLTLCRVLTPRDRGRSGLVVFGAGVAGSARSTRERGSGTSHRRGFAPSHRFLRHWRGLGCCS